MSKIFQWFSKKITSVSNSAASLLLKNILRRFLEEPIVEENLECELFSDWTIKIDIQTSFLSSETINTFFSLFNFESIYFSRIEYHSSYNLSKHSIRIDRCVLSLCDLKENYVPSHTEDLKKSINEFKTQLPVENKDSFSEWLFNCVNNVDLFINRLTIKSGITCEKIVFVIDNLSMSMDKTKESLFHGKIGNISMNVGEHRSRVDVTSINNCEFILSKNTFTLDIPEIQFEIDTMALKEISLTLWTILSRMKKSNEEYISININIGKMIIGSKTGINIVSQNVELSMNGLSTHVIFCSIDINFNNQNILCFNQKDSPLFVTIKFPV